MMQFLEYIFMNGFFLCVSFSLFLILYRLKAGPSLADRVAAVDLFTTVLLTAIVVASIYVKEPIYFDVAIVLALFGFLSTVIFARFIGRQEPTK